MAIVRKAVVLAAAASLYRLLLRERILQLGRDGGGGGRAPARRRAAGGGGRRRDAGGHDRRAGVRGLAVARADRPVPRGGAYTYDWIENLLGLDMHSVDRVLPDFQHPEVGETIAFGANRMRYERVEPEHVLAIRSEDGNWVWMFVLEERGGKTRLVSRNRFRLPRLRDRIGMAPMEPGSLVLERKMLRGIKERAERLDAESKEEAHV